MSRLSTAPLPWFIGSASLLLVACGDDPVPSTGSSAGATSVSGAASGSSGAPAGTGGQQAGGAGAAGAVSSAGTSGTGTGGAVAGASGSAGAGGLGGGSGKCGGALVCDDFESYATTPGAPWEVSKNAQGSVVIDGAQHNSGSKSVKFSLSGAASYQRAFIALAQPFPIAANAFYGRMMIYTTAAPNDGVHWTMIQGEGPVAAHSIERAQVRYGGQHMKRLMANYDTPSMTGPKSDCWQHSQAAMPEGKWACMEWYFEGATNTQKFWLDGAAIDDLTVVNQGEGCGSPGTDNNWYFPSFERLYVGWESYQTDAPRDVWIDDVAIGTSKIGCP